MQFELGDLGSPVSRTRVGDLLQAPLLISATARTHRVVFHGHGLWAPVEEHHRLSQTWSMQALDARLLSLERTSASRHLASRVSGLVASRWATGDGDEDEDPTSLHALLEGVARALGMSRWTLRRHLAANGLAFDDLVEELRVECLPDLLSNPSMSLSDVGSRLGFTSQSAFSRYYRARYGHPPSHDPLWLTRRFGRAVALAPDQTV